MKNCHIKARVSRHTAEILPTTRKVKTIPISLIAYNDQSNTATAATLYSQLITQDKVDILVAALCSPTLIGVPIIQAGAFRSSSCFNKHLEVFLIYIKATSFLAANAVGLTKPATTQHEH